MAETDTSPAALRALAERRTSTQDPRAWIEGERQWVEDVRAALTALAAEKEAGAAADWPTSASKTARRILAILGKADDPSLEAGADERRDRVAALVERYAQSIVAERKVRVPAPAEGPLTEVGETSRGYNLYRAPNPVGGNTYWSDEIGGGVVVWDTCLVGEETLRLALAIETGAPAPDGWIPWEGGRMPVAAGTLIDVKFRNGYTKIGDTAGFMVTGPVFWQHDGSPVDIIAYRLSKEG